MALCGRRGKEKERSKKGRDVETLASHPAETLDQDAVNKKHPLTRQASTSPPRSSSPVASSRPTPSRCPRPFAALDPTLELLASASLQSIGECSAALARPRASRRRRQVAHQSSINTTSVLMSLRMVVCGTRCLLAGSTSASFRLPSLSLRVLASPHTRRHSMGICNSSTKEGEKSSRAGGSLVGWSVERPSAHLAAAALCARL